MLPLGLIPGVGELAKGAMDIVKDGMDKVWPSAEQKASAEAVLIKATSDAAIAQMAQAMSIMLAEAQSDDKWTSRARPSFLYVMYIMMLTALPFAVLYAFNPDVGDRVTVGLQRWLAAIPDGLWNLFMGCFLMYTGGRSAEKIATIWKKP